MSRASLEDVETLTFRVAVLALSLVRLVADFATKGEKTGLDSLYQYRGNVENNR